MIRSIAGSIARPLAVAITGASGGAAPAPADAYAANSFSPDYVADFSAASADYFRVAGVDSDFETAFTDDSEGGGLATMVDSSGKLVWRAHNELDDSENFSGWNKIANGSTTPVVTNNAGVAPNGETTADKIDFGEIDAVDDFSVVTKSVSKSVAYSGAVWVKAFSGSDVGARIFLYITADRTDFVDLTTEWQKITVNKDSATGFIIGAIGSNLSASASNQGAFSALVWGAHFYRSGLGGMADNPDSVATGLEKYVPTTTAARYLARRRHHRWDGSSWVPTCLHEPVGAINEIINSANPLAGSWNAFNLAVAGTTLLGVDTAVEATLSGGNANHRYSQQFNYSATDYVLAVIVSSTDVDWFKLTFYAQIANQGAYFDISTGTVGTVDSGVTAGMVPMGANTYLIWIAKDTPTGGTGTEPGIYAAGGDGTLARNDDGATFKMVGWQLAQATFPSSWIPTAGGSVARTADTLKGRAASFPWSSTAVSMAIKGRHNRVSGTAATLLARYEDADDSLELRVDSSNNAEAYAETGGSSQTASGGAVATGAGAAYSLAMRYVAGSAIQVATGGTAGSEVTASVPATPPLSDNDVLILEGSGTGDVNGTVDRVIGWDEDVAEAGIESASAGVEIQGLPTISGTEAVGSTLTASAATVVGGPSPSTTWQWQRSANGTSGWADISGATSSTYTLVSADEDQYVRAVQTATATAGGDTYTDSANSVASGQVDAERPLNTVTSAVLAFSTARKLRTAYTGDAIRVRRSSDNAEQDIGFDGSGNLDESALTTFVGANDGFVVTVYEQSGDASAVDFVQSTAALQPQIVVSGVVVKQNGKPAMQQPTSGAGSEFVVLNTWGTRPASASLLKVARYRSGASSIVASVAAATPYLGVIEPSAITSISVGAGTGQVWRVDGSDIGTEGAGLTRQDMSNALADDTLHTVSARGVDFSDVAWQGLRTEYSSSSAYDGAEFVAEMLVITDDAERAALEASQSTFYGTP